MALNEVISTGRVHRVLIDKAKKIWRRNSFWTSASDVECSDGKTIEDKITQLYSDLAITTGTPAGEEFDPAISSNEALRSSLASVFLQL